MARGDKSKYTDKQKRQAEKIEKGYEKRGVPKTESERRAWATVNKQTGGGKRGGSGMRAKSAGAATRAKAAGRAAPAKGAASATRAKGSTRATTRKTAPRARAAKGG